MKIIKRKPATVNHVWPSNQVLNLQGNPWNCSCPLLEVTESAALPDGNLSILSARDHYYCKRVDLNFLSLTWVEETLECSWIAEISHPSCGAPLESVFQLASALNQHPFHSDQSRKQAALNNHRRSKRRGKTKNRSEGFIGWKRCFNFSPHGFCKSVVKNHNTSQWCAFRCCYLAKVKCDSALNVTDRGLIQSPSKWESRYFPNVFHGLCAKWTREINGVSGLSQYDLDIFFPLGYLYISYISFELQVKSWASAALALIQQPSTWLMLDLRRKIHLYYYPCVLQQ